MWFRVHIAEWETPYRELVCWLAANPHVIAIGLAWDIQEVGYLPVEEHDIPLHAIITTTRILGPFS